MSLNVLDLFSGIGGFSLGLERAGMRTVAFCECAPYCQAVLRKHWPGVPIHGDIRHFAGVECDIICGGFPCQDISVAGKRAGIDGERSGLWSEYARLIRSLRPRYVIVENVAALLVRGIDRVIGDLAEIGYDAEWDCIPASAIGAPHERDRLFLVAYAGRGAAFGGILPDRLDDFPRDSQWGAAQGVRTGRGWQRWLNQAAEAVDGQITRSDFRGVDDGLPEDMDRIGTLGNSIVPQIAEGIGRAIMRAEGLRR